MFISPRIYKLSGYADTVSAPPDASFQNSRHTKFFCYLTHTFSRVLVLHDRGSGDDLQTLYLRKLSKNIFCNSVSEKLVLGIRAHISEWKHSYAKTIQLLC